MRRRFSWYAFRGLTFYLFFTLEVTIAEANSTYFADDPKGCSQDVKLSRSCVVASGADPFRIVFEGLSWELSKNTVVSISPDRKWKLISGQVVAKIQKPLSIQTPFGRLQVERGKVWMQLSKNRVDVSLLSGLPVYFTDTVGGSRQYLTAGFTNWYGGLGPKGAGVGVPKVIDLKGFASKRAFFFTDHELGFVNELRSLASTVQRATVLASSLHRDLFEGKRGLLEYAYDQKVLKKKRQVQYDKNLRRLFRRKVEYDE